MEISEGWESRQGLFETGGGLIETHNEIYGKEVTLSETCHPRRLRFFLRRVVLSFCCYRAEEKRKKTGDSSTGPCSGKVDKTKKGMAYAMLP